MTQEPTQFSEEDRLRAHMMELLEVTTDAVISVDTSYLITVFNRAAQQIFGYSADEMLGKPLDVLLPPESIGRHQQHMDDFAAEPTAARHMHERTHISGRRKDGSLFPAEASISKSTLDDHFAYTVMLRDITERELTEVAMRENEKREKELQIARRIQAGYLPEHLPEAPGWEIAARFHPATEVAGDFYDAFPLSQNRRIAFVIADVVDHGVAAALFMSLTRSLTRAFAQQNYSLSWADMLTGEQPNRGKRGGARGRELPSTGSNSLHNAVLLTNNYIIDNHIKDNMFATLFFGLLDPSTGHVSYINAGHNPPHILDTEGNVKASLDPSGPAVGMFPGVDFNIEYAQLDPGDTLYAYTDGVTEARNSRGDFLTDDGLFQILRGPINSATGLLDRIESSLADFMVDAEQFDDITMMAVHRSAEG